MYVDDIPEYKNELYGAVVWSRHASAKVSLVDPGEALSMPGVRAFISAKDLQEPESNAFNIVTVTDEKVFVEDEVRIIYCISVCVTNVFAYTMLINIYIIIS